MSTNGFDGAAHARKKLRVDKMRGASAKAVGKRQEVRGEVASLMEQTEGEEMGWKDLSTIIRLGVDTVCGRRTVQESVPVIQNPVREYRANENKLSESWKEVQSAESTEERKRQSKDQSKSKKQTRRTVDKHRNQALQKLCGDLDRAASETTRASSTAC